MIHLKVQRRYDYKIISVSTLKFKALSERKQAIEREYDEAGTIFKNIRKK